MDGGTGFVLISWAVKIISVCVCLCVHVCVCGMDVCVCVSGAGVCYRPETRTP